VELSTLLFAPIVPFVAHPERILAVATLLVVMFLVLRYLRHFWSWPLLWSAGFWAGFALWEWWILVQKANIRVDLFLIYPLLLGITIWSLWSGLRSSRNRKAS
jgi:CDP-diglyceride synthetase